MTIESTHELLDYKDFVKYSKTFIESGTAYADGVKRALEAGFEEIISIEASPMYYEASRKMFTAQDNVQIMLGMSTEVLPNLLKQFDIKTSVFYLDAHVSGDTSAGYEDWIEKGEESEYAQDKTIKAELKIILEHSNKHVIIIDDVNGLADGHANEYAEIMHAANPDYKFYFMDENLSGNFLYKEKLLVAIPG